MGRELRRLLIAPERLEAAWHQGQRLHPTADESHYLRRVLRCRHGEAIALVDGAGGLCSARLEADGWLRLEPGGQRQPAGPCPIQLALAPPRRDGDLVWRMATELGVDRLQPLLAQRSQPQPMPLERWRAIVREAVEQSERLWLPPLEEPQAASAWLSLPPSGVALLATTRRQGLPELETLLGNPAQNPPPRALNLAIGPEGGWTDAEEKAAEQAGWLAVSLGPTILRCSTAAVAAAARLVSWRTLSCAESRQP